MPFSLKLKLLFLISFVFIFVSCGPNVQQKETTYILPDNPYGENLVEEKEHFLSPVEIGLPPIPELRLRNGEMESFRIVFPAETGSKVRSVSSGTVVKIQNKRLPDMTEEERQLGMLGKYVIVDIGDGISIRYAHLSEVTVEEGKGLSPGDEIGIVGNSGMALLDSEQPICGVYVLKNGLQVNPLQYFQIDEKSEIIIC